MKTFRKDVKSYTEPQIWDKYNKLKQREKIDTLETALQYMLQPTSKNVLICIAKAMGYNNKANKFNTWYKETDL